MISLHLNILKNTSIGLFARPRCRFQTRYYPLEGSQNQLKESKIGLQSWQCVVCFFTGKFISPLISQQREYLTERNVYKKVNRELDWVFLDVKK